MTYVELKKAVRMCADGIPLSKVSHELGYSMANISQQLTKFLQSDEYAKNYSEEKREINMRAINEFVNPTVGEGSDIDPDDSDKRFYALKRAFNKMYKPQKQNT